MGTRKLFVLLMFDKVYYNPNVMFMSVWRMPNDATLDYLMLILYNTSSDLLQAFI